MTEDLDDLVEQTWAERTECWASAISTATTFLGQVATKALDGGDPARIDCRHSRIKASDRAAAKIRRKIGEDRLDATPTDGDAIEASISDICGVKVLCKSTRDLIAFREQLESTCPTEMVSFAEDSVDYVTTPKQTGYRAYHAVLAIQSPLFTEPHT